MTRGLISEDEASEKLCLDFGQSESGAMLAALESDRSRSRDALEHVRRQLQQLKGDNVKVNYETFELAAFCLGRIEVRFRQHVKYQFCLASLHVLHVSMISSSFSLLAYCVITNSPRAYIVLGRVEACSEC